MGARRERRTLEAADQRDGRGWSVESLGGIHRRGAHDAEAVLMGVAMRITPAQAEPKGGHGRGETARSEQQPRIPLIGVDAGAIPGTKPQPGCSGAYLDRCARDIVRGHLRRHRRKDHRA